MDGALVRLAAPEPLPDDIRAALRAHKPEIVAALSARALEEDEVARRVQAFREQMKTAPRWRPFMVLPGVKSEIGTCLSCGNALPEGREIRCALCVEAAHIVLEGKASLGT